jgi:hypothetical protein
MQINDKPIVWIYQERSLSNEATMKYLLMGGARYIENTLKKPK